MYIFTHVETVVNVVMLAAVGSILYAFVPALAYTEYATVPALFVIAYDVGPVLVDASRNVQYVNSTLQELVTESP